MNIRLLGIMSFLAFMSFSGWSQDATLREEMMEPQGPSVNLSLAEREYENVFDVEVWDADGKLMPIKEAAIIQSRIHDVAEDAFITTRSMYFIDPKDGTLISFPRVKIVQKEDAYVIQSSSDEFLSPAYAFFRLDRQSFELKGRIHILGKGQSFTVRGKRRYCPTQLVKFLPRGENEAPLTLREYTGLYEGGIRQGKKFLWIGKFNVEAFSETDLMASFSHDGEVFISFTFSELDLEHNLVSFVSGARRRGLIKWVLRCKKEKTTSCTGYGYSAITGKSYEVSFTKTAESDFFKPVPR